MIATLKKLDIVSAVSLAVILAALVSLLAAPAAHAQCMKYCGYCRNGCTQRADPKCTGGDTCLVVACNSTFMCFGGRSCGYSCQDTPNCC